MSSRSGSVRSCVAALPPGLVPVLPAAATGLRVLRYEGRILCRYRIKDEIWAFCLVS